MAKFEKGHQLATGRPKGSPNKITKTLREAFTEAFNALQEDSESNLITWGKNNPTPFYMIASKLFPDELNKSLDKKVITVRYLGDDGIEDAQIIP